MSTETDETAASRTYTLSCIDCAFETTIEGDVLDVLDVIDVHQEEHTIDGFEHFVEFESEVAE